MSAEIVRLPVAPRPLPVASWDLGDEFRRWQAAYVAAGLLRTAAIVSLAARIEKENG